PDQVLAYFLERGQVSEVFIHNMELQSAERTEKLAAEEEAEKKSLGFVAVAAGDGNADILKSLGVNVVVSGGQTMNPSTKDLLEAAQSVNAEAVIILPNNSNIVMAANSAADLAEFPCAVVPTKSVPQAFSALFAVDQDASLETNVEEMTEAAQAVKSGEVTWAIKDSKDAEGNPIHEGDVIGIADGSIDAVDSTVEGAVLTLLEKMDADDADTCTILAGEDYTDEQLEALVARIEEAYEDLEIDAQRGGQPLYPIIFSVE
ncbi:MAG: DAK2 domain-containing protein, partial [Eggerthellaceae bacterium]|nr:DAK2 domain-containing protein [Eggerthellaceae bacterium]